MTRYEISLNDGSTDKVESATYSIGDGWVFFHGEKGEPTYAYPEKRVDRVSVAEQKVATEPSIVFNAPLTALTDTEIADIVKRYVAGIALRGAL
jgi:hypothetical protein